MGFNTLPVLTATGQTVGPSYKTTFKYQDRVLVNNFGDGYKQVAEDGINHLVQTADMVWGALCQADMWTLIGFFKTQGGATPFYYQKPEDPVALLWRCQKYEKEQLAPNVWRVTATFTQEFDLTGT